MFKPEGKFLDQAAFEAASEVKTDINNQEKNQLPSRQYIDLPEHLADFDVRKKAVENLGNNQCRKMEEKIMSGESTFSENELIRYLEYLNDLEIEIHKVEHWLQHEEMVRIVKHYQKNFSDLDVDCFGIENDKIFVEFGDSSPQEHAGSGINYEDENQLAMIDKSHAQKEKTLGYLSKIGGEKTIGKMIELMLKNEDWLFLHADKVIDIYKINSAHSVDKLLEGLTKNKFDERFIGNEIPIFCCTLPITDLIGAEETRNKLNDLIQQKRQEKNGDAVNNLEYARSLITPNHDKIAIENLQKFYAEKIKFEDYGINQKMNGKEVELLKSLISQDEKVLEEGCGTGRLLLELKQAGYDITGYDFTKRHVDLIKAKDQEAKVFQGDWHNNAIKDESFNTVYSLGRNILHDYSIVDQAQLFREAARILKPGGKFIFDIPDRNQGGYKQMVDEYGREMESRGIRNFRQGAIYDSPDGVNFTTRYAYSEEDIKMLAQLAGFRIKETRREELATGQGDENIYFVLEKI